jgi:hypothetical protein
MTIYQKKIAPPHLLMKTVGSMALLPASRIRFEI